MADTMKFEAPENEAKAAQLGKSVAAWLPRRTVKAFAAGLLAKEQNINGLAEIIARAISARADELAHGLLGGANWRVVELERIVAEQNARLAAVAKAVNECSSPLNPTPPQA